MIYLNFNTLIIILLFFIIVVLITSYIYIKKYANDFLKNNTKLLIEKVNYFENKYQDSILKSSENIPLINYPGNVDILKRDLDVLYNPLYPALSRQDLYNTKRYMRYVNDGLFNLNTRDIVDTYHPVAYLFEHSTNEKLILFGRQKFKNGNSDFYISPVNAKFSTIKIPLDNKQANDIYNLPEKITLKNMYEGTYIVQEFKNPDLYNNIYY
jgi:hypothetical protein